MYPLFIILCSALCSLSLAHADIGFRQITLQPHSPRPVNVSFWYPTEAKGTVEIIGENAAFYGEQVLRNAKPTTNSHPLLLLSHGYGGSWRNLNWLAAAMAKQGYIVAAPDHPGTTTDNHSPHAAQQLWLRPQDINHVLDVLLSNSQLAGKVDDSRIAAVGHSLGGWTVLELAGGQFSSPDFIDDCKLRSQHSDCQLIETLGIANIASQRWLDSSQPNLHIKAVVSLDLGLARGFTPASLAKINVPVLVLSAQDDSPDLPSSMESGYLAEYLPSDMVSYTRVRGATHFSFMQRCKPNAAALINTFSPGEGIICSDQGTLHRAAIHQDIINRIIPFLSAALNLATGETGSASSR